MKGVNKAAGDAQSGLKEVNKQLNFDPKNVVLSGQKVDLLKDKIAALEDKQKTLKAAVNQAHEAFDKGDLGKDKVQAVEREYEKTNSQLKDSKKALLEAEAATGSFTAKAKLKFSDLKDKIKDTFSSENIKSALGAIGAATGAFLKSSADEAADAEKANTDLAQSLKSTHGAAGMTMDSLNELSESLSKNTTFEDDEVKSGEAMLLTFTNIGKNVFPQATAATLDYSQKMGVDAKSAALTLGKALNDPATGLSKLTKSGVTFTDQQKKQITEMEKAGNVAGAQKLMIAELNKEFGGQAAAAADTYAGKQKQIANQVKEVKEAIGTALLPVLLKIVNTVSPIIQKIADFVSKNPQLTAAILAVIAVVGTLVGGMSLLNTVTSTFGITLNAALLPTIGIVAAAIAGIIVAAIAIKANWGPISGFFINLWDTIKSAFSGVGAWFQSVFAAGASGVQSAWSGITGFFSGVWSGITVIFSVVGGWFSNIFGAAWNGIKSIWSGVTGFFSGVWHGITGIFGTVGSWFSHIFKGAYSSITNAFSGLTGFFSGIWNGIVGAFKSGINFMISGINSFIKGLNMIHFDAPKWVPLIGGKSFGISIPQIPLLAQGGIVDKATLAMVGEAGKEAVLPLDRNTGWMKQLSTLMAETFKNIIPLFDSGPQVRTAMAAAYGGYSAPVPAGGNRSETSNSAPQTSGDVKVYQYFQGKTPSPAEHARLTRNSLQQIVKKMR